MPRIFTVTTVLIVFTLIIASTPVQTQSTTSTISSASPNLASITKALQMKLDQAQRFDKFPGAQVDLHSSVVKLPRVFRNTSQALSRVAWQT